MQLSGNYSDLSNAELDDSYASSYASMQNSTGAIKLTWANAVAAQALEIIDRISGVFGFLKGSVGINQFPKYDDIQKKGGGGFQQSATAQTAISAHASDVSKTIGDAVGKIGLAGLGLGIAALSLLIMLRKK